LEHVDEFIGSRVTNKVIEINLASIYAENSLACQSIACGAVLSLFYN